MARERIITGWWCSGGGKGQEGRRGGGGKKLVGVVVGKGKLIRSNFSNRSKYTYCCT